MLSTYLALFMISTYFKRWYKFLKLSLSYRLSTTGSFSNVTVIVNTLIEENYSRLKLCSLTYYNPLPVKLAGITKKLKSKNKVIKVISYYTCASKLNATKHSVLKPPSLGKYFRKCFFSNFFKSLELKVCVVCEYPVSIRNRVKNCWYWQCKCFEAWYDMTVKNGISIEKLSHMAADLNRVTYEYAWMHGLIYISYSIFAWLCNVE